MLFRKVMSNLQRTVYVWSEVHNLLPCLRSSLPELNFKQIRLAEECKKCTEILPEEIEILKDAEILITDAAVISKILDYIPNMKWVQSTWAGVEAIFQNFDKSKLPKFIFTKLGNEGFADYMAEYIIAQIIINERKFYEMWDDQKENKWTLRKIERGRLLENLTVGILGVGAIGKRVAKFLKQRGSIVYGFAKHPRTVEEFGSFDNIFTDISELLKQCDYICNVLPSTSETKGLLNGNTLQKCLKKPVFINIGRGDIIKEADLIHALNEKWISRAVLDVFQTEPLPSDNPLWKTPEVIITPHIGAITQYHQVAECFKENYKRFISGRELLYTVDWNKGY
ncbi:uncharacterized protein LOC111630577 [Centruroides sculpturatus]|uniref:uncharacterized protein LOC111630577 n=1 Tax=Centruroides sculpturatus TaxID=218467 RepID=UPI000C6CBB50|nr:uncharacterized protein LOC111630577 [Centruroides sculpturatus]